MYVTRLHVHVHVFSCCAHALSLNSVLFNLGHVCSICQDTCVCTLDSHIPTFAVYCRMEVRAPWVHQQDILQGHVADVSCAVPMHGPRKLVKLLVRLFSTCAAS